MANIVKRVDDIPLVSPDEYLLVRFGDPDVGTPFVTSNAEELLQQVNAISPSGGGDCPEKSVTGILRAIDAASFGSRIHVFTDASSKDGMLKESVKSAAKAKEIYINFAVTGSCSPIDPVYEEIARDTGGQLVVLENVSSAVEDYFDLVEPGLTGDFEPLMLLSKTLGESSEDAYFPVDSTMTSFVINVNMETKGTILLYRPAGSAVLESDTDAAISELPNGKVINITSPEPGSWRLNIDGTSGTPYTISAQGNTPLTFHSFEFVERKGKPGHEGLFPIQGDPLMGIETTAIATIFGSVSNAEFLLASEEGSIMQYPLLEQGNAEVDPEDFVGTVTPPAQRFRVYVRGKDMNGYSFIRTYPPMYQAQPLKVESLPLQCDYDLLADSTFGASYRVTYFGEGAGRFSLEATTNCGSVKSVSQSDVELAQGASSEIEVLLDIPADTPDETPVYLTLTATNDADTGQTNSAMVSRLAQAAPPQVPVTVPASGGGGGGCFIQSLLKGKILSQ